LEFKIQQEYASFFKNELCYRRFDDLLFDAHFADVQAPSSIHYAAINLGKSGFLLFVLESSDDTVASGTVLSATASFFNECIADSKQLGEFDLYETSSQYLDCIKRRIDDSAAVKAALMHISTAKQRLEIANFTASPINIEIDFDEIRLFEANNTPITTRIGAPTVADFDFSIVSRVSIKNAEHDITLFHKLPKPVKKIELTAKADFDDLEKAAELIMFQLESYDIGMKEKVRFQLALNELLLNAVEHGVFGISYEGKKCLTEAGEYEEYLASLISSEKGKNHIVKIGVEECVLKNSNTLCVEIKDYGRGFDVSSFINKYYNCTDNCLVSGRGIVMSREACDGVYYNQKGNEVLILKHLNKGLHEY